MTAITARSKRPLVHVIVAMTSKAVHGLFDFVYHRRMAACADEFRVCTLQLKVGLISVIKNPCSPCVGIVAATTLASERAFVFV